MISLLCDLRSRCVVDESFPRKRCSLREETESRSKVNLFAFVFILFLSICRVSSIEMVLFLFFLLFFSWSNCNVNACASHKVLVYLQLQCSLIDFLWPFSALHSRSNVHNILSIYHLVLGENVSSRTPHSMVLLLSIETSTKKSEKREEKSEKYKNETITQLFISFVLVNFTHSFGHFHFLSVQWHERCSHLTSYIFSHSLHTFHIWFSSRAVSFFFYFLLHILYMTISITFIAKNHNREIHERMENWSNQLIFS